MYEGTFRFGSMNISFSFAFLISLQLNSVCLFIYSDGFISFHPFPTSSYTTDLVTDEQQKIHNTRQKQKETKTQKNPSENKEVVCEKYERVNIVLQMIDTQNS